MYCGTNCGCLYLLGVGNYIGGFDDFFTPISAMANSVHGADDPARGGAVSVSIS